MRNIETSGGNSSNIGICKTRVRFKAMRKGLLKHIDV